MQPQPPAFGLLGGHLEPLLPPEPFDPLLIHPPPLGPQQRRDPPVAVAPVLRGQPRHGGNQRRVRCGAARGIPLRRPGLAEDSTCPALGDPQVPLHVHHRLPPPRRAQKFPFAASRRIALSSAWSATSFLSRVFSRSSSLSRLA